MDESNALREMLPSIVRKLLDNVLTEGERRRLRLTAKFTEAYKPFEVAVRGGVYALVYMTEPGETQIYWALTTRVFGRINLIKGDDDYAELLLILRVVEAMRRDPLYRTIPDVVELRS